MKIARLPISHHFRRLNAILCANQIHQKFITELAKLGNTTVRSGSNFTYTHNISSAGGTIRIKSALFKKLENLEFNKVNNSDMGGILNECMNAFFHQVIDSPNPPNWMRDIARSAVIVEYEPLIRPRRTSPIRRARAIEIGMEMIDEAMSEIAEGLTPNLSRHIPVKNPSDASSAPLHNEGLFNRWAYEPFLTASNKRAPGYIVEMVFWIIRNGSENPAPGTEDWADRMKALDAFWKNGRNW